MQGLIHSRFHSSTSVYKKILFPSRIHGLIGGLLTPACTSEFFFALSNQSYKLWEIFRCYAFQSERQFHHNKDLVKGTINSFVTFPTVGNGDTVQLGLHIDRVGFFDGSWLSLEGTLLSHHWHDGDTLMSSFTWQSTLMGHPLVWRGTLMYPYWHWWVLTDIRRCIEDHHWYDRLHWWILILKWLCTSMGLHQH